MTEYQTTWLAYAGVIYGVVWLAFAALGSAVIVQSIRPLSPTARRGLLGLTLASLALRLGLATWGPGDLQMNLFFPHLGPAVPPILKAWLAVVTPTAVSLTVPTLLLGSLLPPLVWLVASERADDAVEAWGAGLFTMLHPLLVRFCGDANRAPFVLIPAAVALLAILRARTTPRVVPLAAAALGALLAASSRPESAPLAPALAIVVAAVASPGRARRAGLATLAVASCAVTAVWLLTDQSGYAPHYLARFLDHVRSQPLPLWPPETVLLNVRFTPLVAIALVAVGTWSGLRRGPTRWTVGLIAATMVVGWPVASETLAGAPLALARYHVGTLLFGALLAGLGVRPGRDALRNLFSRRRRFLSIAVAACAFGSLIPPFLGVIPERTVDAEYRLALATLRRLPRETIVYYVAPPPEEGIEVGFRPTIFDRPGSVLAPLFPEWRLWPPTTDDHARPRVFFRQSACSADLRIPGSALVHTRCDEADRRYAARPLVERTFPARPYGYEEYAGPLVRLGFYAMEGPPVSLGDP